MPVAIQALVPEAKLSSPKISQMKKQGHVTSSKWFDFWGGYTLQNKKNTPENGGLEDDFAFQLADFLGSILVFRGAC